MAPPPDLIPGLERLAPDYDALLCDVWGVLHNGVERFAPAVDALMRYRALGGAVVLISNSPRPAAELVSQLAAFGVGEAAFTAVVTSGDVTRALLKARSGRRVFAIGPERDAPLYQGLDLVFVDLETADFISCTGPVDDERETAEDYRAILERGQARGLEMICANPDRVVQRGERLIVCAGALADIYGDLGGRVLTAGKPHAPIYEEALRAAARGRPLLKSRVLAIGDGVQTDVQGANREGLDCLFIAGGIHAAATLEGGELSSRGLAAALAREGACARYALAALRW